MSSETKLSALRIGMFSKASGTKTRICAVKGCKITTREGKLYCTEHVEQHPYIKQLLRKMEERRLEDENVRMRGSKVANIEGITAQEILLHLRHHGPRTIERLTRDTQIDNQIISNYTVALRDRGIVTLGKTQRNNTKVVLVNANEDDFIEDDD